MYFDFPTILFLVSIVALLVWLMDACLWEPGRDKSNQELRGEKIDTENKDKKSALEKQLKREPVFVDICKAFFPVIVLVLLLRSFVAEPFRIPSGSMIPTLLIGDFILVNKFSYGIRMPIINKVMIKTDDPKPGEVAVFRFPDEPTTNYIKRIVGVPGDIVEFKDKKLVINGKPLPYQEMGIYSDIGGGQDPQNRDQLLIEETLGLHTHATVLISRQDTQYSCMDKANNRFVVKKDEYFVMGDNRDNSNDSRYWCGVPKENLVGRAFAVWMNWDPVVNVRWSRMFKSIK